MYTQYVCIYNMYIQYVYTTCMLCVQMYIHTQYAHIDIIKYGHHCTVYIVLYTHIVFYMRGVFYIKIGISYTDWHFIFQYFFLINI